MVTSFKFSLCIVPHSDLFNYLYVEFQNSFRHGSPAPSRVTTPRAPPPPPFPSSSSTSSSFVHQRLRASSPSAARSRDPSPAPGTVAWGTGSIARWHMLSRLLQTILMTLAIFGVLQIDTHYQHTEVGMHREAIGSRGKAQATQRLGTGAE